MAARIALNDPGYVHLVFDLSRSGRCTASFTNVYSFQSPGALVFSVGHRESSSSVISNQHLIELCDVSFDNE